MSNQEKPTLIDFLRELQEKRSNERASYEKVNQIIIRLHDTLISWLEEAIAQKLCRVEIHQSDFSSSYPSFCLHFLDCMIHLYAHAVGSIHGYWCIWMKISTDRTKTSGMYFDIYRLPQQEDLWGIGKINIPRLLQHPDGLEPLTQENFVLALQRLILFSTQSGEANDKI